MTEHEAARVPDGRITFHIAIAILIAAVAFFLVHEPAKGGDSWGAWFLARLIWEHGEFPVPGRSPFYTTIVAAFWPLGYPLGPGLLRIVDACFICGGLYALFRCYLTPRLAVLAALIWLPSLLALESIVKGHAVAALCFALAFRHGKPSKPRLVYSYAFLILAFMFRVNYAVALAGFLVYDGARLLLAVRAGRPRPDLRPPRQMWLIAALAALLVVFSWQKPEHRWNNAYYADAQWLGVHDASLSSAAQIGSFVHWVIVNRYGGDFDNHDIYFVAKNDLPEFKSILDIRKYPEVLFGRIISNVQIVSIVSRITDLGDGLFKLCSRAGSHVLSYPIFYALLLFGLWQFWRTQVDAASRRPFLEIVGVCCFVTLPLFIAWPSGTYFFHFVPIYVFAAVGMAAWFAARPGLSNIREKLGPLMLIAILVAFSGFTSRMLHVSTDAGSLASWQRPHLVKEVMDGHYNEVESLTENCRGIMMTSDYEMMAAFSEKPTDSFYSIFEIPPFDRLGDSPYDGLRTDRIDCVFVDKRVVKRGLNTFTTKWSRYENYIAPYVAALEKMGARTYTVDAAGDLQVTVLRPPG